MSGATADAPVAAKPLPVPPPTDTLSALIMVIDLLRTIDARLADAHALASEPGPMPATAAKAPEGGR